MKSLYWTQNNLDPLLSTISITTCKKIQQEMPSEATNDKYYCLTVNNNLIYLEIKFHLNKFSKND